MKTKHETCADHRGHVKSPQIVYGFLLGDGLLYVKFDCIPDGIILIREDYPTSDSDKYGYASSGGTAEC